MKRYLIIAALAAGFAGSALAQSATVTIAPEQRTTIKQYVVKEKVKPITVKERIWSGRRCRLTLSCRPFHRRGDLRSLSIGTCTRMTTCIWLSLIAVES